MSVLNEHYITGFFMAIKTTLEQLEEVQEAITEVMTSQELTSGPDLRVVRAKLEGLSKREEILLARYRAETGDSSLKTIGIMRRN